MKRIVLLGILLSASFFCLNAQKSDDMKWNNKKCAVVLSYDDALDVHLDNVIPSLDSAGLKGTFYIHGSSSCLQNRIEDWRAAAASGHELGNHTLFHPCAGSPAGREWVAPEYDLDKYTTSQIINEIKICNALLQAIDGKTERTFAFTCGDRQTQGEFFFESLKNTFPSARGVWSGLNNIDSLDRFNLRCYNADQVSGEKLIEAVEQAQKEEALLIFMFHGVGGGHGINASVEAHQMLVDYLMQNRDSILVAPLVELTSYMN